MKNENEAVAHQDSIPEMSEKVLLGLQRAQEAVGNDEELLKFVEQLRESWDTHASNIIELAVRLHLLSFLDGPQVVGVLKIWRERYTREAFSQAAMMASRRES